MNEFQKYLKQEVDKRHMSHRSFAQLIGVSQTTISRHLDGSGPHAPSIELLIALAKYTNTSLITLLMLAYPDLPTNLLVGADGRARLIAERIAALPPDRREIVDRFLLSLEQIEEREE